MKAYILENFVLNEQVAVLLWIKALFVHNEKTEVIQWPSDKHQALPSALPFFAVLPSFPKYKCNCKILNIICCNKKKDIILKKDTVDIW